LIKNVHIRNFQCHKEKTLETNPGITYVTGSSDTGKSAIIRAVEWVRTNRPSGTSHINRDATGASVKIETERGSAQRIRNNKVNGYRVNGTTYKAVGGKVPDEVHEVLNLTDLNVQRQHDPPFLLTLSPGEIGRRLNQFADLEEADRVLSELNSDVRKVQSTIRRLDDEIGTLKTDLEGFHGIEEIGGRVEGAKQIDNRISTHQQNESRLTDLINRTVSRKRSLDALSPLSEAEEQQANLSHTRTQFEATGKQIERLGTLIKRLENVSEWRDIELPETTQPSQIKEQVVERSALEKRLQTLITNVESAQERLENAEEDFKQAEVDYNKFVTEELGGKCPTCGKPMEEDEC